MAALDKNTLVAVIGAGAMGARIAQIALQAGHPVALFDNRANAAQQAVQGLALQLGRLVEREGWARRVLRMFSVAAWA